MPGGHRAKNTKLRDERKIDTCYCLYIFKEARTTCGKTLGKIDNPTRKQAKTAFKRI